MVQLEEKTTAELASLKEKIAHMEADMEVFSDLAALERQEEERREVTHVCTYHLAVCIGCVASQTVWPFCMPYVVLVLYEQVFLGWL